MIIVATLRDSVEKRATVWLNPDRLLLFISVAEPIYERMKGVALKVDGKAFILD